MVALIVVYKAEVLTTNVAIKVVLKFMVLSCRSKSLTFLFVKLARAAAAFKSFFRRKSEIHFGLFSVCVKTENRNFVLI